MKKKEIIKFIIAVAISLSAIAGGFYIIYKTNNYMNTNKEVNKDYLEENNSSQDEEKEKEEIKDENKDENQNVEEAKLEEKNSTQNTTSEEKKQEQQKNLEKIEEYKKNNPAQSNNTVDNKPIEKETTTEKQRQIEKPVQPPVKQSYTAPIASGDNYVGEIEQIIFAKVNEERAKAGIFSLSYNNTMQYYARLKSKDMADRQYFDHKSPEGSQVIDKIKADGLAYKSWGENIAYIKGMSGNANVANQFMINWMNSPGHKQNILSPNYTSVGVGVYKIGDTYYATQEFFK